MFEPGRYLQRALQIVWNYKVLWVFAFLIALFGGGGSGAPSFNYRFGGNSNPTEIRDFGQLGQNSPEMQKVFDWFEQNVTPLFATQAKAITTVLVGIAILLGLMLIFGLIAALVRYPAETAVLRMVDEHERSGAKLRFREGWKLGWNHRAWRMFLVDLLIGTPAFALFAFLFGGLAIYMFANSDRLEAAMTPGFVVWIIVAFFLMMGLSFLMLVVSLVRQYIVRKIALEDAGVWEGFRQGWDMFKKSLKHTILTWLILLGIGIGVGIAMVLVMVILIPAYALLAIPGAVVAAIPALIGYAITALFSGPVLPWIIAAALGLPLFFLVVFSPLTLVNGVYVVFGLNVWTLLYRDRVASLAAQQVVPPLPGEVPPLPPQ